MHPSFVKSAKGAIPLHAISKTGLTAFRSRRSKADAAWLKAAGFKAQAGELVLIPSEDGTGLGAAVLGLGKGGDTLALATFAEKLPAGTYVFDDVPKELGGAQGALAWALGTYVFARYRKSTRNAVKLVVANAADNAAASRIAEGVFLTRDLINTPASDMGPAELAKAANDLAKTHKAKFSVTMGAALLKANYPMIHAVGRASVREPRLIDMTWGRANAPRLTLVGKGVCFDSGGLDLKNASGMLTMKKDMGGAAAVLGLAHMVMSAKLNVRLRVLIPAVENSVSGNAFRPGDVLTSRKGLTVEIGNTDAEGRLVLADALAEADDETPDLLIDMATLTGAARMATGMELPPFFTDDDALADDLSDAGMAVNDPVWRLPLWRGYEATLSSPIADLNNTANYNLAGAITAALFLNNFVESAKSWIHLDIPGWIDRARPGRRSGGEANAARALFEMLRARYGSK